MRWEKFTAWLPGWDSVADTGRWSQTYFWLGVVCAGLVVFAQIAQAYQSRKTVGALHSSRINWFSIVCGSLTIFALVAQHHYDSRNDILVNADIWKQLAPRKLTDDQRETLIKALHPYRDQKIKVFCFFGNEEGKAFAAEFVSLFRAAGWDPGKHAGVRMIPFDLEPVGVQVVVSQKDADEDLMLESAHALISTLMDLKLINQHFKDAGVEQGNFEIRIGRKPSG